MLTKEWKIKAIEKSLKKSNSRNAKFIDHEKISAWLLSWGAELELKAPKTKNS